MSSTQPEAERRTRIVEQLQADTGIDEVMIEKLVHAFYARVRCDELIGPYSRHASRNGTTTCSACVNSGRR